MKNTKKVTAILLTMAMLIGMMTMFASAASTVDSGSIGAVRETKQNNPMNSSVAVGDYVDYYADDLRPFFERKWQYLFDFNMEIVSKLCELLDVRPHISLTDTYADAALLGADDLRDAIRPKHPAADPAFEPRPYYQVYAARHGFQPNMSVLDLLCNEGPEGIFYL